MLIRDCSVDQQIATDLPPKVYERPMLVSVIRRHSGAMQSVELRCAVAHLRISRFPGVQLHP
jgi:hypothetical protein